MEEKLSRFLSFLLRHKPEALVLYMDKEGWVNVNELIKKINSDTKYHLNKKMLEDIVANDNKGRYVFKGKNHDFIRACQGHSIKDLDLKFESIEPPDVLYHGTSKSHYKLIKTTGIKPMTRQYVHLSQDFDTAVNVGSRHGDVVVLKIDTKKMYENGLKFYQAENGVWLTDFVDTKYFLYD